MNRNKASAFVLMFLALFAAFALVAVPGEAAAQVQKQLIYDEAGLLNPEQIGKLTELASVYGAERETDFLIVTSKNAENGDVKKMTQNFYDQHAPGYDKPHGNAAILMLDMRNREVYLAGFYKAKEYLDDGRLTKIRTKITPDLTSGDYELAFETFIKTAHHYMGYQPGVNPDNILFQFWFQLTVSLVLAGIIVGMMAYHSGGRITVTRQTYEDAGTSAILDKNDRYLHTTTTRQKIEKKSGGSGGGGGGGTTGGGHSHSGSRGSF
ncbi:TPM domain-containing protein [Paenibacillus sp. GYB004]|uniref:TPM domain-containing protein n=1 Tax=Paenibacillus sp. GYB004 TaxID=2994393 RepID=UPI002F96AF40